MRRAGLIATASATLLLAGCGDDGESTVTITEGKGGGTELFEAITNAQLEAETANFDMSMTVSGSGAEQNLVDASGAIRATSATSGDVTMDMSVPDPTVGTVDMTMTIIDNVIYTDMFQSVGAQMPTPWVSIDPTNDDPASQLFAGALGDQQAMADARAMLTENADLVEVEEGEQGTVDGVEATEYLMTVSIDDLLEIGAFPEGQLGADASELPIDEITYSFWVDDEYLPVSIGFDMEIEGVTLTMEMRFSDWGEPVTIEAPPASDVTDIGDAMAALLGVDEITEEQLEMLQQSFGV